MHGIQGYWSQIFILPQKVIKLIQTTCRTFLWTGKAAVSRRALVAWDKICLPKQAGGLAIVNLKLWNQAAICKMLWNLAQKKDKVWVKWVHGYYIKGQNLIEMNVPVQCSWVIKKILGVREYLRNLNDGMGRLQQNTFTIKSVYKALCGEAQSVEWHKLICHNIAPPKCVFISWLIMHDSLATCDHMRRIGIQVDPLCCFCGSEDENLDHLFFECPWTSEVWKEVSRWCGVNRDRLGWQMERIYLVTQCRTKNQRQIMYRCSFSITSYLIWQERNARRMQDCGSSRENVIRQCKNLIAWCCNRHPKAARLIGS